MGNEQWEETQAVHPCPAQDPVLTLSPSWAFPVGVKTTEWGMDCLTWASDLPPLASVSSSGKCVRCYLNQLIGGSDGKSTSLGVRRIQGQSQSGHFLAGRTRKSHLTSLNLIFLTYWDNINLRGVNEIISVKEHFRRQVYRKCEQPKSPEAAGNNKALTPCQARHQKHRVNHPGPCPQRAQAVGRENSWHLQCNVTGATQWVAQKKGHFSWLTG